MTDTSARDYEIVRQIHENLTELAEEHKEDEIPLTLTKPEVKDLFGKRAAWAGAPGALR